MKPLLYSIVLFAFFSCNNKGADNSKMHYGAPPAKVTSTASMDTAVKGPLGYGAAVPQTIDGDTVEVKFDITHRLISISPTITFTAWTFGNTVPGPVLKIRQGQTVKFSMTNRSNQHTPA